MNAVDPWCQSAASNCASTSERNSIACGVDADDVLVIVGARDGDDAPPKRAKANEILKACR